MATNVRTHIGDAPTDTALRPKHLTKQEFGRRLYKLMVAKGWSQSDLARAADVARDSVSTYIRGRSLPEPDNLDKLAKSLGVSAIELLPNHIESAIDNDEPSLEMKVSNADPRMAWLRVTGSCQRPPASRWWNCWAAMCCRKGSDMATIQRALPKEEVELFRNAAFNGPLLYAKTAWSFIFPDPRELWPWGEKIMFPPEPYDDGGGAVVAEVRYQRCY